MPSVMSRRRVGAGEGWLAAREGCARRFVINAATVVRWISLPTVDQNFTFSAVSLRRRRHSSAAAPAPGGMASSLVRVQVLDDRGLVWSADGAHLPPPCKLTPPRIHRERTRVGTLDKCVRRMVTYLARSRLRRGADTAQGNIARLSRGT